MAMSRSGTPGDRGIFERGGARCRAAAGRDQGAGHCRAISGERFIRVLQSALGAADEYQARHKASRYFQGRGPDIEQVRAVWECLDKYGGPFCSARRRGSPTRCMRRSAPGSRTYAVDLSPKLARFCDTILGLGSHAGMDRRRAGEPEGDRGARSRVLTAAFAAAHVSPGRVRGRS